MVDAVGTKLMTPFLVGDWQADPSTGRILKSGEEVKLEPKVMQVLVFLAENQGKVVSRDDLESAAWAGMVVGYDAVSGSIIKLRKALGDDSRNPRYIETVSKKGYRLIAPVSTGMVDNQDPSATKQKSPEISFGRANFLAIGAGALIVFGLLLFFISRTESVNQTAKTSVEIPSVLVMPFKNLSGDSQQDYFSDGITDDLITDLSRVDSVRVIAPQSSYYFQSNPAGLDEIARQLGVLYIVEGSIRKSGNYIRINIQLTDTKKRENVWANRYETNAGDIFKIQDEITRNVMDAMYLTLSGGGMEYVTNRGTSNLDAYDAFLLGQKYIKTRTRQGYDQTIKAYRRAIEIDPDYARAYGALAVTIIRGYRYQWSDLSLVEARERALELAEKAVALNQSNPQIFWSLAYVHLHRLEYDEAEKAAKQSIVLSPNFADGYALLANIANWRGKPTEAVNYMNKAINLNPYYSFQYPSTLGLAFYELGRYEEAANALRQALERNENALNPHLFLAATYIRLGMVDEATWEIEQVGANHPDAKLSDLGTMFPFEQKKYLMSLTDDLRRAGLSE